MGGAVVKAAQAAGLEEKEEVLMVALEWGVTILMAVVQRTLTLLPQVTLLSLIFVTF